MYQQAGQGSVLGYQQDAAQAKATYVGDPTEQTGLVRLANQISEASAQVNYVADHLTRLSIGIHGPRPEPVSTGQAGANSPNADSLSSRVSQLLVSIERLRQSYESIVR